MAENEENDVSKVLFELASTRRASILFEVEKKSLKMQQIAKSLDMTATETCRHLQRLSDANLLDRKGDGTYSVTEFGTLAIDFLSSFDFILKNKSYFLQHATSSMPYEFVNRLGELSIGTYSGNVLESTNHIRQMVFDAEEYILVMADQVDSSHIQATNEKVSLGLKFQFIMEKGLAKTVGARAQQAPEFEKRKERKYLDRICGALMVTEKEAYIGLRGINGLIDFSGFFGQDDRFRKWCLDLFNHYWEKAHIWYPGVKIE
jgi:predicted transcriptional regulator